MLFTICFESISVFQLVNSLIDEIKLGIFENKYGNSGEKEEDEIVKLLSKEILIRFY